MLQLLLFTLQTTAKLRVESEEALSHAAAYRVESEEALSHAASTCSPQAGGRLR